MLNELEQDLDETLAVITAASRTPQKTTAEEGQLTFDVYQTGDEVVIQSAVAGVGNDDIDISISKDTVTIRGQRQRTEKVKDKDFYHKEIYWGAFSRSVILPVDINVEKAKASIKNGLLTIRLPKLK